MATNKAIVTCILVVSLVGSEYAAANTPSVSVTQATYIGLVDDEGVCPVVLDYVVEGGEWTTICVVAVGSASEIPVCYSGDSPISYLQVPGQVVYVVQVIGANGDVLASAKTSFRCRGYCDSAADCVDLYACNGELCLSNGTCVHTNPETLNCCQNSVECPLGQHCSSENKCVECLVDEHCDDSNQCTVDSCQEGGYCYNIKWDPDCCDCNSPKSQALQCADSKFCTLDSCDCETHTCQHDDIQLPDGEVCCEGSAFECDNGDYCDINMCINNVCFTFDKCCHDYDCYDQPCMNGTCNGWQCEYTKISGCCVQDSDCDESYEPGWCVDGGCEYPPIENPCSVPLGGRLVVTEWMGPSVDGSSAGWIELHNTTKTTLDVDGWRLRPAGWAGPLVPLPEMNVSPGEYVVLCGNSDDADYCIPSENDAAQLSVLGSHVVLEKPLFDGWQLVDEVNFGGTVSVEASSLERNNPFADGTLGQVVWYPSLAPLPIEIGYGTPGEANSVWAPVAVTDCDGLVCTTDACEVYEELSNGVTPVAGVCQVVDLGDADCCDEPEIDCPEPPACFAPLCIEFECAEVAIDGCCVDDSECDGVNGCAIHKCVANQCIWLELEDGEPCNDGNSCTAGDSCVAGFCIAGPELDCSDDDPCTYDDCHSAVGCTHEPYSHCCFSPLDCQEIDACGKDGGCCLEDSDCASEPCAEATCSLGFCKPVDSTYAPCDDGDVCTAGSFCADGECSGGSPIVCNDGNLCTIDSCSPGIGCVSETIDGCCVSDQDCPIGQYCADAVCVEHVSVEEAAVTEELPNEDAGEVVARVEHAPAELQGEDNSGGIADTKDVASSTQSSDGGGGCSASGQRSGHYGVFWVGFLLVFGLRSARSGRKGMKGGGVRKTVLVSEGAVET